MFDYKFAAFIMTYERPLILKETIRKIFEQTFIPSKILVVDNSESKETETLINSLNRPEVVYHRVGFNSGPAGAAKIGLEILTDEGYDWIYWGDDDDPPFFSDTFEILFQLIDEKRTQNPGIVGAVGQYFNVSTGEIKRVEDAILKMQPCLGVDSIAGGQCMIVNAEVLKKGTVPDERLFFGFEELDFCLRVQTAGFSLLVSTDLFLRLREKYGRLNYQRPLYTEKSNLTRQYYSTRNLLLILKKNKLYKAYAYQLIKNTAKLFYGFKYGIDYGKRNFAFVLRGICDGITNRFRNLHEKKY
jgi:GT2 family glycosyltransferase